MAMTSSLQSAAAAPFWPERRADVSSSGRLGFCSEPRIRTLAKAPRFRTGVAARRQHGRRGRLHLHAELLTPGHSEGDSNVQNREHHSDLLGIEDAGGGALLFKFGSRNIDEEWQEMKAETSQNGSTSLAPESVGVVEVVEALEEGERVEEGGQTGGGDAGGISSVDEAIEEKIGVVENEVEVERHALSDDLDDAERVLRGSLDSTPTKQIHLELDVGVSSVPHPARASRGGEDAHLVEGNWLGVADGISVWAEQGVNSGLYSRELMWNCVDVIRNGDEGLHPKAVIEESHSRTDLRGSCTVVLAVLDHQTLKVANIGDSGFMLVRGGDVVARSEDMLHSFNQPFQIGCNVGDDPSCAVEYEVRAEEGDVLLLGTDGLFDNLFDDAIVALVREGVEKGKDPENLARRLTAMAHKQGESSTAETPFGSEAKVAGQQHEGGRRDDVTVLVAFLGRSKGDEESE